MRSARGAALTLVVTIAVVLTGCGTNDDDERFLAVVDELMGRSSEVEFPEDDLIAAGRAVCAEVDADDDPSVPEATAGVAEALGTDEFVAHLLALAATQVYCPQNFPTDAL